MKLINQSIQIWNQNDVTYSEHIERCGRVCYQSDHLVKEGSDVGFVNRIMKSGHTSVIEHYWVGLLIPNTENPALITNLAEAKYLYVGYRNERHVMVYGNLRGWLDFVYANPFSYTLRTTLWRLYPLIFKCDPGFGGLYDVAQLSGDCLPITVQIITDRGIATQMLRHRPLSPSNESTRFCNYSKGKFSSHIQIVRPNDWNDISKLEQDQLVDLLHRIEAYYMTSARKAEDKREILPLGLKSELIMTGTRSMWRDVYRQRKDAPAQPKVREIMRMINEEIDIS